MSADLSVERDVLDQADLAWHGLFYLLLLVPAVLATIADPAPGRSLPTWGLVVATMVWHAALTLPGQAPGDDLSLWRGLLALIGSCVGVLVLFGLGETFTLSVYGLIPQAFVLLGRWGAVAAAAVVVAIGLRYRGFDLNGPSGGFELAGSIILSVALGGFVHLIARQGLRRREALQALAAARVELDEAARREGVLAERQRLAGEMHDTVAQLMVGVVTQLEATQRALATDGERAQSHLARAVAAARDGLGEIRAAVQAIRPDGLGGGLVTATRLTVRRWSSDTGLPVEIRVTGEPGELAADAQHALLRGVQEALANVARHARANAVRLTIGAGEGWVTVRVADDGRGFDTARSAGGYGLATMRDRLAATGGTVSIDSAPGSGTTVIMQVQR
ncbi:sensor histidine kinase [Amycolatopsis sp.]|uniref:sensor histidine kinase n=1 Tax=Amycolatopsis sp. TaxID=37632 RepID=UPI002D7EAF33|nr:sensor histidine kinase [Amycolatopsis sp.]HET6706658.1 sensor histidine kinase [Amycolatopsis sp.]